MKANLIFKTRIKFPDGITHTLHSKTSWFFYKLKLLLFDDLKLKDWKDIRPINMHRYCNTEKIKKEKLK